MLVYRVENEDKEGPFRTYHDAYHALHEGMISFWHPTPQNDGLMMEWSLVCACPDLGSVRHWFGHCAEALSENGFGLFALEVPDQYVKVGRSGKQVVFPRERAVSERCIDWSNV